MEPKILEAFHPGLGRKVHIKDALNGLACGCICTVCGGVLEAVQGKDREWHYRHHNHTLCPGAAMTELHRRAIGMLLGNNAITVNGKMLRYFNASPTGKAGKFLPDLSTECLGDTMLIEVKVTHGCEEEKVNFYKLNKIRSFEIDLSDLKADVCDEDLRYELFENPANKELIYWPPIAAETSSSSVFSWAWIAGGIIFLLGIGWLLIKPGRGKNRRRRRGYSLLRMPKKSYGI